MGPLIPLFVTSGDVSSGFQNQSQQPYLHLAEVYVMYVPSIGILVPRLMTVLQKTTWTAKVKVAAFISFYLKFSCYNNS